MKQKYPGENKGDRLDSWYTNLPWRFIDKHRQKLAKNIRMKFMINLFDKMDDEKKNLHISTANTFLKSLS